MPCETQGGREEARAWIGLGNFAYGVELCARERQLVTAAGLTGSAYELGLLDFEADIRAKKTEYSASRAISETIVRLTSVDNSVLFHANTLANIVSLDIALGNLTSETAVTAGLAQTRQTFTTAGYTLGLPMCDRIFADFLAASGQKHAAKEGYEKCVRASQGKSVAVMAASLRKLGDITLGLCDLDSTTCWATTYLAFSKSKGSVLLVAWALRLLGDISRAKGDDKTACLLLQVALDEFTRMDVHQGRAECFLGLSDIAKRRGDHAVGMGHFEAARQMFEKSGLPLKPGRTY
ncbi:hypothetical protein FB451DRAFT_1460921 [Mycena latifolia]|nr:hypothetical protein FB451DRAFT_1460921 [Mycena latifolia]